MSGPQIPALAVQQVNDVFPGTVPRIPAGSLTLTTTPDGKSAVWALSGATLAPLTQSAYFVRVGGNDTTGDGSDAAPFATVAKLSQVISPGMQMRTISSNVTITIGAGVFGNIRLYLDVLPGFKLQIFGHVVSGSPITIASHVVTNSVTNTRGQLTTAAGTFHADTRIRAVSGANSGAMARTMNLNAGVLNPFVSEWLKPLTFGVVPAIDGTTLVEDTNDTTLLGLTINTPDNVVGFGSVEVWNMILPNGIRCNSGAVNFIACDIAQVLWAEHCAYYCCNFPNQIQCIHGMFFMFGCGFHDLSLAEQFACMSFGAGNFANGGRFLATIGGRLTFANPFEFENGVAGHAIELFLGNATGYASGKLWGASAAYTTGVKIDAGCMFVNNTVFQVAIPATNEISLAGKVVSYASVTTSRYTRAMASIVIDPDASATVLST